VLVIAIGTAGSERAQAELQKLGDNLVWVEAGSRNADFQSTHWSNRAREVVW